MEFHLTLKKCLIFLKYVINGILNLIKNDLLGSIKTKNWKSIGSTCYLQVLIIHTNYERNATIQNRQIKIDFFLAKKEEISFSQRNFLIGNVKVIFLLDIRSATCLLSQS